MDIPVLTRLEGDPKYTCPVGSVEFVEQYYKTHFNIDLKPINIPNSLKSFTGREVIELRLPLPHKDDESYYVFVKSTSKTKWKGNGPYKKSELSDSTIFPDDIYQVSQIVNIVAEFRCFVYESKIVDVRRYLGDIWTYPDKTTIEAIIEAFKDAPTAYTLDIAVIQNSLGEKRTVVIEVHDFYSCGLYGFRDLDKLPFMYWRSHLDKLLKYK